MQEVEPNTVRLDTAVPSLVVRTNITWIFQYIAKPLKIENLTSKPQRLVMPKDNGVSVLYGSIYSIVRQMIFDWENK